MSSIKELPFEGEPSLQNAVVRFLVFSWCYEGFPWYPLSPPQSSAGSLCSFKAHHCLFRYPRSGYFIRLSWWMYQMTVASFGPWSPLRTETESSTVLCRSFPGPPQVLRALLRLKMPSSSRPMLYTSFPGIISKAAVCLPKSRVPPDSNLGPTDMVLLMPKMPGR